MDWISFRSPLTGSGVLVLADGQPILADHDFHNIDHVGDGLCDVHPVFPRFPALDRGIQQPHPAGSGGSYHLTANGSGLRTFHAKSIPYDRITFERPFTVPGIEHDAVGGGRGAKMDQAANGLRR